MSSQTISAEKNSGRRITVPAPTPDSDITISSPLGGVLIFTFDFANASITRSGHTLILTLEKGEKVTLENFFSVGEQPLPDFVLFDGTAVTAPAYLSTLRPGFDLSTDAGPDDPSVTSGGTKYEEITSTLITGVDKSTVLADTFGQWDNSRATPAVSVISHAAQHSAGHSIPPSGIIVPDPGPGGGGAQLPPPVLHFADGNSAFEEAQLAGGSRPWQGVGENPLSREINLQDYTVDTTSWTALGNGSFRLDVTQGGANGGAGHFLLGADGKLSFTVDSPFLNGQGEADDAWLLSLSLPLQSADGQTVIGHLSVTVNDDAPVVTVAATGNAISGMAEAHIADLNVNFGADGSGGFLINGTAATFNAGTGDYSYTDTKGSYRITADGKVFFKAGANATDSFGVIISAVDGDGDIVAATGNLTVNVTEKNLDVTIGQGMSGAQVAESGLATGTTAGTGASTGWLSLDIPAGVSVLPGTYPGSYGNLVMRDNGDGTYSYNYTLTSPVTTTPAVNNGPVVALDVEKFDLNIADAHGNTGTANITVDIKDDTPVITVAATGNAISGMAETHIADLNVNFGADGSGGFLFNGTAATFNAGTGEYTYADAKGSYRITADGKVFFKAASNTADSFGLVISAVDGDGDTVAATGNLTVSVTEKNLDVTLGNGAGGAQVAESGLATGTTAGTGASTGWLSLDLPAGVSVLPGTYPGSNGSLTVRDNGDGTYSYNYTLTSPVTTTPAANDGPAVALDVESFDLNIADAHGNTGTASITVDIKDDAPVITVAATGNAISGMAETHIADLNVNFGADGSGGFLINGSAATFNAGTGQYTYADAKGSYRITADGKVFFKAANNTTDSFGLVISAVDGDGDTVAATGNLMVNVTENTLDVTIGNGAGGAQVAESGLATGTTAGTGASTGWLSLDIPAGLSVLPGTYAGSNGNLTVRDNGDGTYSYSYTLTSPVTTTPAVNDGPAVALDVESFDLHIADVHGNTGTATLTVDIKDDAPVVTVAATGNAISGMAEAHIADLNVNFGADGSGGFRINGTAATFNAGTGEYSYTDAKGSYRITADGKVFFKAGANATDSFGVTISAVDGDGDIVAATGNLTVNVTENTLDMTIGNGAGGAQVAESGLATGTTAGTGASTGWLSLDIPAGVSALPGTYPGSHGSLTVRDNGDGTYSYNYTLTSPVTTAPAVSDGPAVALDVESFDLNIADTHGNTGTATITVDVKDDAPVITVAATGNAISGMAETHIADLNVNFGADGSGGFRINGTAATFNAGTGQYTYADAKGSYRITADGKVFFKAASNTADSFGLVISAVDGDGDTVAATGNLTVSVTEKNLDVTFGNGAGGAQVAESGLATGTTAGTGASTGWLSLDLPAGVSVLPGTYPGSNGSLTVRDNGDGTYSYNYTLTSPVTTTPAANDGPAVALDVESFDLNIADAHGNTGTASITVDIKDDAPVITVAATGNAISGMAETHIADLNVNFGADGSGGFLINGSAATFNAGTGQYTYADAKGSYRITADGKVFFKAANNTTDSFGLVISAVDGDGDTVAATGNLTVNVTENTLDVTIGNGAGGAQVAESGLATGTTAGTGASTGWLSLDLPAGLSVLPGTYAGSNGSLTVRDNGDGTYSYSYTLTSPVTTTPAVNDGPAVALDVESFDLNIADVHGNTGTATLTVDIKDDAPVVTVAATGNAISGMAEAHIADLNVNFGADGSGGFLINGTAATFNAGTGEYSYTDAKGSYRITADGKVFFKAGANATDSFGVTISAVDGDGDIVAATGNLTVNVTENTLDMTIGNGAGGAQVAESGLATGTTAGTGASTGWLSLDIPAGVSALPGTYPGSHGSLTVRDNGDGTYSYNYTLTSPVTTTPAVNDGPAIALDVESFDLNIADTHGNTGTATITVDIKDDAPVTSVTATGNAVSGMAETHIADLNVNFGADGSGGFLINGTAATFNSGTGEYTYADAKGSYRITADGKVFFKAASNTAESFGVTISAVDGDGDTVAATGNLTVNSQEVLLELNALDTVVHEAALTNGTGQDWSNGSSTVDTTASGTFTIGSAANTVTITLGGVDTHLTLADLASSPTVTVNGDTLSITNMSGGNYAYTYTLGTAKTHETSGGQTGERVHNDLTISVTNSGGGTASVTGEIVVVNDEIQATPDNFVVSMPQVPGVSITLVLDTSASMTYVVSDTTTRWDMAVQALLDMLDKYQQVYPETTEFEVNLATFSTPGVGGVAATYTSIEAAKAALLGLPIPSGTTSYRDGLLTAQGLVESSISRNPEYEQKIYFITDGEPSLPYSVPDSWKAFANGEHRDLLEINAIGVGPGATSSLAAEYIKEALSKGDAGDKYIPVLNEPDLANALLGTVFAVSGGIFDFSSGQTVALGADKGFLLSKVTIDGQEYTFGTKDFVTVVLHDGFLMQLFKDGSYTLEAKANQVTFNVVIRFEITDADGDTAVVEKEVIFDFHNPDPFIDAVDNIGQVQLLTNGGTDYDLRLGYYTETTGSGAPTGTLGAHYAAARDAILAMPHSGVAASTDAEIIIRATGSIDASMPLEADGTTLTMQELYQKAGMDPTQYKDAGFITLPTFTVNSASTVVVRWYWDGGAAGDTDAAFWVLVDASGKMVKFGKFASGDAVINNQAQNLHIRVDAPGDYKVMLIAADSVKGGGTDSGWDAYLSYFGSYVVADKTNQIYVEGNVITDPSSDGQVDSSFPKKGVHLTGVTYNGTSYSFGSFGAVIIDTTDGGKLLVYENGAYKYFGTPGAPESFTGLDIEYTVENSLGYSDTATLHLGYTLTAFDNTAAVVSLSQAGADYDLRLGYYSEATGTGAPTGVIGANFAGARTAILSMPHLGVAGSSDAEIIVRATGNINGYMPLEDDGSPLTMKELYEKAGMNPLEYKDAGFITLPTFTVSSAATVVVRWYWDGGAGDTDAAFWVLVDASGKMVKFGTFASGDAVVNNQTQNLHIRVDTPGDYKVMLIAADSVRVGGTDSNWDAYLSVFGAYIVADKADMLFYKGNLITDPSPDGTVDFSSPKGLSLKEVTYNGETYTFTTFGAAIITTDDGGRLLVYQDGTYKYFGAAGHPEQFTGLDLSYTVQNSQGLTDTAHLHLRDEEHTFRGSSQNDTLSGSAGNDVLIGGAGNDTISGGDGDDIIYGGSGHDILNGNAGDDIFYAGLGNDTIYGGAGNDLIYSGKGHNTLHGGTGADVFIYTADDLGTKDYIKDFSIEEGDKFNLWGLIEEPQATTVNDLIALLDFVAAPDHVIITYHGKGADQVINADIKGSFTLGDVQYEDWSAFSEQYSHSSNAAQEAMLHELALKLLTD